MSRADFALDGSQVRAAFVLRADDAALAVSGLDGDGDGHVSQGEVDRAAAALKVAFIDSVQVVADESRCLALLDAVELEGPDGLRLHGTYTCPRLPARLRFHFGFFDLMPSSHRSFVTVHTDRGDSEALCTMANPDLDVRVSDASSHGFVSLLRGGIGHILAGQTTWLS